MSNAYPISYLYATENFDFPPEFYEFIDQFPLSFKSIFEKDIKNMGKHAFYHQVCQWASYQIFIGILDLDDIPGRKEFFNFYKGK